ncbi:MAG: citrate lyase subunit alpha [Sulfitobacter sp.]|nr:citrate lyase subunit alpha [Sulfitobacter sp.]
MQKLPREIVGYGPVRSYEASSGGKAGIRSKVLANLDAAIAACGLKDGDTVSFHHHLRNGDAVLNLVMVALARRGLKNLQVAASSIFPVHAPLVAHMCSGTVDRLSTSFISGPVGEAISSGLLGKPVVLTSHGGRARALDEGALKIDVAFVAAPAADALGNISGRMGPNACGTLGYPLTDVDVAERVVAVTDRLVPFPVAAIDIPQNKVDFVVAVDRIGDQGGIASGTTQPSDDPVSLAIGESAAAVIAASGLLREGFSFQTGAGSVSLRTAEAVGREMATSGIRGSFCAGGITGQHVKMLQSGLFETLMDVQCFDLEAVASYQRDVRHQAMSAAAYAGPHVGGAVVDRVDAVVLGAAEVDHAFNVNVTTKADGVIIGGSGGHADAAAGSRLTLVTTRLTAAGFAKIVPDVGHVTTPGTTVDVLVTDAGIAVNPKRADLADRLKQAGLPVVRIETLADMAAERATRKRPPRAAGRIVAVSEYRDGSVIDVVRQIERDEEPQQRTPA